MNWNQKFLCKQLTDKNITRGMYLSRVLVRYELSILHLVLTKPFLWHPIKCYGRRVALFCIFKCNLDVSISHSFLTSQEAEGHDLVLLFFTFLQNSRAKTRKHLTALKKHQRGGNGFVSFLNILTELIHDQMWSFPRFRNCLEPMKIIF